MKKLLLTIALITIIPAHVICSDISDTLALQVTTGPGYYSILPNKILLTSTVNQPGYSKASIKWSKNSGPGNVSIERPDSAITWATVDLPGQYSFKVLASSGTFVSEGIVKVNVYPTGSGFGNPLLPGMFPDPHILYDGGRFYIYATSMENSKGAYGRASVWVSDDFVNWNMKLTNWPEYGKFGGEIWAPDIIRKDNKYYQFITRSGGYDTWIAVADHPEGPWKNLREDNTAIVSARGNAGRIVPGYNMDAHPFIDEDGQAYMYWGWSESMAAKLTPDLKNIDGDVHFLKKPNLTDFVEGSYMIKRNGIYYLLYSTGALHDGSYSVHYAMAGNPLGPFIRPNPNIVIRKNKEETTRGPGHNSILKFEDRYYIVYHQHNQPHVDAGGVFRQTCADLMEFNDDGTIKEVIPTQTGVGALKTMQKQRSNIALGKYASATSYRSASYVPEYAFDQNNASKWVAADSIYPQTLTVELGGKYDISGIETSFEYPTLSYKYMIETSTNGKKWKIFADKTDEFPIAVSPQKDIGNVRAAYVRITITECQRPENGAGIYELKIFDKR